MQETGDSTTRSITVDMCMVRKAALGRTRITWDRDGLITEVVEVDTDSTGYAALPGLIDSHFHGFAGIDTAFAVPSPEEWRNLDAGLLSRGITSYVPGIAFSNLRMISEMAKSIQTAAVDGLLGVLAEGTFVNPDASGGLPKDQFRPADRGFCAEMLAAGEGFICTVLVSPEIEGACELIAFLRENGVIPAIGHSRATYEQAVRAIHAGACRAIHWPNAMKWGDHHDPAIAVAVLNDDRMCVEVIGDNMHVSAPMLELAARVKGDRLVMVSDSVAAAGAVDDPCVLAALGLEMRDGRLFMVGTDTHSGSYRTLDECHRTQLAIQNLRPECITSACSTNAADSLSRYNLGELAVGKRADIVLVDELGDVERVYRKGFRLL